MSFASQFQLSPQALYGEQRCRPLCPFCGCRALTVILSHKKELERERERERERESCGMEEWGGGGGGGLGPLH